MAEKSSKYVAAPAQSKHSDQLVRRALYWIKSKAYDVQLGRQTMCEFQGNYDALQNMNLPIVCQKTGTRKGTGKPIFRCFKHPPLDKPQRKGKALKLDTYSPKGSYYEW